jgi:peptidoglycan/LPS O-acetylase OafA/YrhL
VEEHFYLALAVLLPLAARRRVSPRLIIAVLAAVLVAALALRVHGALTGTGDVELQWRSHFRVDSLAAGVLLAALSVHRPALWQRLLGHRWAWIAVTGVGVAVLAVVGKESIPGTTIGFTVAHLTAAAFLLALYEARWVPRARPITVPLAALGRYAYGVYIWHFAAAHVVLGPAYEDGTPLVQALKYGAAIAVGVLATVLVEQPVLRLRDRLLSDRRTEAPRATAVQTVRRPDGCSLSLPRCSASLSAVSSAGVTAAVRLL